MTGIEQFISGQAIAQCHQVRAGWHVLTEAYEEQHLKKTNSLLSIHLGGA